jgi:hypothetical protein
MPSAGDKAFTAFLKFFPYLDIVIAPACCIAHQAHISGQQNGEENLDDFQVHEPFEQSRTPCYGLALKMSRILGIKPELTRA